MLSLDEIVAEAQVAMKPTPHPVLPWFTPAELRAWLALPDGPQQVAALFKEREQRIELAGEEGDPLTFGFELEPWRRADELLQSGNKFLYVAGGKRASKSEWAAKRFVQSAMKYPRGVLWAFQDNHPTSIATQQKLVWKFLPPHIKALNGKPDRRRTFSVNYSPKNGFSDGVLVLPNRTTMHFLTYNSEVTDYQGWEIGAVVRADDMDPNIANLGFWADENMPLSWMETCEFRATTRNAKGIWTFSTTEGITTTIKEVLGSAKTIESRPAELLAGRLNLPGLPLGHMPYVQEAQRNGWRAIYFFSEFNVFGDNYANVKQLCHGRASQYIEENAYGYARDVMNKAFPLFGEWNIIPPDRVPAAVTRYMFTDPAGARNWATLWVAVDAAGNFYIYRDWPEADLHGEWAVPSDDPRQPDGDIGPAQRSLGLGIDQLKAEWLKRENGEPILIRYIDPRAGRNQHIDEQGGTCAVDMFMRGESPMVFTPASSPARTGSARAGITECNELLYWDTNKELCAIVNAPKLFVTSNCQQVIWMFQNYTDRGGEKAGSKDFADLVRYMALADLLHVNDQTCRSTGGGSY